MTLLINWLFTAEHSLVVGAFSTAFSLDLGPIFVYAHLNPSKIGILEVQRKAIKMVNDTRQTSPVSVYQIKIFVTKV